MQTDLVVSSCLTLLARGDVGGILPSPQSLLADLPMLVRVGSTIALLSGLELLLIANEVVLIWSALRLFAQQATRMPDLPPE